ncbi:hypothetical protein KY359_02925 [Candidatus Woesearchaeota archaeon]|nr:hypothetical protein [Candidatus Woesearchaeota archaeon]
MNDYENQSRHSRPVRSTLNEYFVDAGKILRYLIGSDEKLETLIICNPYRQRFVTTDQELYHAIGSIKSYDEFKLNKLSKFFEMVSIRTVAKKQVLTDDTVDRLRAEALRK